MTRPSRIQTVLDHLAARGHISQGTATIEYGNFRLSDVIHRLRTDAKHLVPPGKTIVTIHKKDTKGNDYGEYHLVSTASAAQRQAVESARASAAQASNRL